MQKTSHQQVVVHQVLVQFQYYDMNLKLALKTPPGSAQLQNWEGQDSKWKVAGLDRLAHCKYLRKWATAIRPRFSRVSYFIFECFNIRSPLSFLKPPQCALVNNIQLIIYIFFITKPHSLLHICATWSLPQTGHLQLDSQQFFIRPPAWSILCIGIRIWMIMMNTVTRVHTGTPSRPCSTWRHLAASLASSCNGFFFASNRAASAANVSLHARAGSCVGFSSLPSPGF